MWQQNVLNGHIFQSISRHRLVQFTLFVLFFFKERAWRKCQKQFPRLQYDIDIEFQMWYILKHVCMHSCMSMTHVWTVEHNRNSHLILHCDALNICLCIPQSIVRSFYLNRSLHAIHFQNDFHQYCKLHHHFDRLPSLRRLLLLLLLRLLVST